MTIKLHQGGTFTGAHSVSEVLRAVVQQQARTIVGDVLADLAVTDNTGGTVVEYIVLPKKQVGIATNGNPLAANSTELDAAMEAVVNNLSNLLAHTDDVASKLGLDEIVDNSGATPGTAGTLAAVDFDLTPANDGVAVEAFNDVIRATNNFMATVAGRIHVIGASVAAPVGSIVMHGDGTNEDVIAPRTIDLTTDVESAVQVGVVSVASANAVLKDYANGLATLAAKLNKAAEVTNAPLVVAI